MEKWLDAIEGTWVLKSTEFRGSVDLDGDGNMRPTTEVKTLIYELLGVFDNCSSLDDIPFEFTDVPPKNKDELGQRITGWVFDY